MFERPLVSFVVPTRNSARTIEACLRSIRNQAYNEVEVIVVDNNSIDGTATISERLADKVITAGPERSAQRNIGGRRANGEFVAFIDSDMILSPNIAREIAQGFQMDGKLEALVLPEAVDGPSFWEKCRGVEKQLIMGDADVEAARAFRRQTFLELGGYDEALTGPEDWDLPDRISADGGEIGRIKATVMHDEGELRLWDTFRKKMYYGRSWRSFKDKHPERAQAHTVRSNALRKALQRFPSDPLHVGGLLFLKSVEFAGFGLGSFLGSPKAKKRAPQAWEKRTLIVSHEMFEGGAPQALERYLGPKAKSLDITLLPFVGAPEPRIGHRRYRNGAAVSQSRSGFMARPKSMPVALARDALYTAYAVARRARKYDFVVAVDPFNAALLLAMRSLRIFDAPVVFHTIDFVPQRFDSQRLNNLYHHSDEWCARNADVVWNVSPAIQKGRDSLASGIIGWAPNLTVPVGVDDVVAHPQQQIKRRLVYLGHVLEKQGLQFVIPALPELCKRFPDLELTIVGTGPYVDTLRTLAHEHGVSNRVDFRGYVESDKQAFDILAGGGIGLAVYTDDENSFSRYADPGKLKVYAGAALPIVMTDVPYVAQTMQETGVARLVDQDPAEIVEAVTAWLSNEEAFVAASAAALRWGNAFTWNKIFDRAFKAMQSLEEGE